MHLRLKILSGLLVFCIGLLDLPATASADDDSADLAKKLSNPVASLISVPFQFNYDSGYGTADGEKAYVNVQPVIPFSISEDWNVISRTILPIAWQDDIAGNTGAIPRKGSRTIAARVSRTSRRSSGVMLSPIFRVSRRRRSRSSACALRR